MEPERKIEKLLRAFAKKRRADAGDALKLHPANRRILQDAVARQAQARGAGDEGSLFLLLLAVFRRRLVFALCVVAIAAVGVFLLVPGSRQTNRTREVIAINHLQQIAQAVNVFESESNRLPASLDEIKDQLASDKVLLDPQSGKPFVYAGLLSNGVVAYSLVNKDGRASVAFIDGHIETRNAWGLAELTNQKSVELALADTSTRERLAKENAESPIPAVTPAPKSETISEPEKVKFEVAASRSFVQIGPANLQNLYRNDAVSARTAPVLQSFQMQQNGNAISVVDRDGSVYHGSLQLTNATAFDEPAPAQTLAASAATPPTQTKIAQAAGNEQQAVQNYFFRVSGMNRTLKQNVVFSGNLLANSAASRPTQTTNFIGGFSGMAGGGGGGGNQFQQAAVNQSQQSMLSNSRIVGTAVIASTNQIEINAVPVTQ